MGFDQMFKHHHVVISLFEAQIVSEFENKLIRSDFTQHDMHSSI